MISQRPGIFDSVSRTTPFSGRSPIVIAHLVYFMDLQRLTHRLAAIFPVFSRIFPVNDHRQLCLCSCFVLNVVKPKARSIFTSYHGLRMKGVYRPGISYLDFGRPSGPFTCASGSHSPSQIGAVALGVCFLD